MGFESKCSILNGKVPVIYAEKSKLNIADMRLIPLDCVTYVTYLSEQPMNIFSTISMSLSLMASRSASTWRSNLRKMLRAVRSNMESSGSGT